MTGWLSFITAMAGFLLAHMIPVRPRIKGPLVARLGARGFGLAYSALSLGLLTWLIVAAGRAPFVPLWDFAEWQAVMALVLMLVACVLVAHAVVGTNPLSFGSRAAPFDPDRPGIAGVTRHPVLLALALWAMAHLLPNGDLAHVILFGAMGVFALLGMGLIDRRKRRETGEEWYRQSRATALVPFAALLSGRWKPQCWSPLWPGIAGIAIWAALIWLHPRVIGVTPWMH